MVGPLDIVVANAGVFLSKPLIENTEADYDYVFDINTRGVFFILQEAARRDAPAAREDAFRAWVSIAVGCSSSASGMSNSSPSGMTPMH